MSMSVQIGASEHITHGRFLYSFKFPIVGFCYLQTADKVKLVAGLAFCGVIAGAVYFLKGFAISMVITASIGAAVVSLFSFYVAYSIACYFNFPNGGRLPPLNCRLITKGPYLPLEIPR